MKKRLLSVLLALTLLLSLAVPSLAAQPETPESRLARVTASVKETLALDTDLYTDYNGEMEENPLVPIWNLRWSTSDGAILEVQATEEGKILRYYRNDPSASHPGSGAFAPAFPAGSRDSARQAASAFLGRVMGSGETFAFREESTPPFLGMSAYSFRGEILVGGIHTGLSFSIGVDCESNTVRTFDRDAYEGNIMGPIPSATSAITREQATAPLRSVLKLRLEYVLPREDSTQALLRYLPETTDDYYVDASTGELVNLSEIFRQAGNGIFGDDNYAADAESPSSPSPSPEGGMSQAEQEGIAQMEGVMSREDLDRAARAISALGLEAYTLSSAVYTADRESQASGSGVPVQAQLRYGRQEGSSTRTRYVTVNARTGQLLEVWSSGAVPQDAPRTVSFSAAQTAAENFLRETAPAFAGASALYDSSQCDTTSQYAWTHSFRFARQSDGIFFPAASASVQVDVVDGSIATYQLTDPENITFESPEGILSPDEAITAWLGTYEVALAYEKIPTAVDFSQPQFAPLEDMGIRYICVLKPGWTLYRSTYLEGIQARTGAPVSPDDGGTQQLSYTDLTGHWAKGQIEKLALYGVGYSGGTFQPTRPLTQLDLLALLVSTQGDVYDPTDKDAADLLYQQAYSMHILTREERDDAAPLSRIQVVKLILDAGGYGPVARLEGIYRAAFADEKDIPAACYGYAALAQGLKIVQGSPGSLFRPNDSCTRAEAAVMLFNLMSRT